MGPDLRIAMPQVGAPRMGPPVFVPSAPVTTPNATYMQTPHAPTPGQTAANAINYNTLRGNIPQPGTLNCKGCGSEGPSLRDISPPAFLANAPKWVLWVGGLAGLGGAHALIILLARR